MSRRRWTRRSARTATGGWFRRLVLPTLWLTATVLAKASGIVFGPACLLLIGLEYVWTTPGGRRWHLLFRLVGDVTVIGTAALTLGVLYIGTEWQPSEALPV